MGPQAQAIALGSQSESTWCRRGVSGAPCWGVRGGAAKRLRRPFPVGDAVRHEGFRKDGVYPTPATLQGGYQLARRPEQRWCRHVQTWLRRIERQYRRSAMRAQSMVALTPGRQARLGQGCLSQVEWTAANP